MKVHKTDNTNFKGFEFKNAHAKHVFEERLKTTFEPTATGIKNYIRTTANEPNKIILDVLRSDWLFATFSHDKNAIVVEKTHNFLEENILTFFKRAAKKAGYPYEDGQIQAPPPRTIFGDIDIFD